MDNKDGCAIHRLELIKNFAALQHDVYIISKRKVLVGFEVSLKETHINVTEVNSKNILKIILYIYHIFFLCFRKKIDILYTRNILFCGFGIILKKLNKSKLVFEKNGIASDEADTISKSLGDDKNLVKKIEQHIYPNFFENMELFFLKHCDVIIAVTPLIKKYLIEKGIDEQKIYVIENAANTELFKPMEQDIVKNELGLDKNCRYVCFVGNLAPWQGVEYLIQAAPLVLKEFPCTKFLIVGNGMLKRELINLVEKTGVYSNFTFKGIVPYEEVPKYINASDICVVYKKPLKSGYSPLKLYEYMSCGKPVVASNLPGFDILEKEKAGIVTEPENPEELANSITKLLKDDKLREEMGKNGREYVVKYNSWENVAKRTVEICEETIRGKNKMQ